MKGDSGTNDYKSSLNNSKVNNTISDITKILIFNGTLAREDTLINPNVHLKKPPIMKLNMPISTKSKMNDIYNEILKDQFPKEKNSIMSSLLQYTNRSSKRKINTTMEKVSPSNKSNIIRAKSQLCSLLGEDYSSKKNIKKPKMKDSDRISSMKNQLDQMLKKDNSQKINCIPMPQAITKPSSERYILKVNNDSEMKGMNRIPDQLYTIKDDISYSLKHKREGIINNTDLLFQLKLGLTKI